MLTKEVKQDRNSESREKWLSARAIRKELGISPGLLLRHTENIRSVQESLGSKRVVTLYSLSDVTTNFREYLALPKVEKITGRYLDEKGESWFAAETAAAETGFSSSIMPRYLASISQIEGRDRVGRQTRLYSESEAKNALDRLLSLPGVDSEVGSYKDPDGKVWVPVQYFRNLLNYEGKLSGFLEGLPFIKGRGRNNQPVTLFPEEDVIAKLSQIISLPQVDRISGVYMDEQNVEWVTKQYFCESAGVTNLGVKKFLSGTSKITGRDKIGHLTVLYPKFSVEEKIRKFSKLPRVVQQNRTHIDHSGDEWVTAKFFCNYYGISYDGLRKYLEGAKTKAGRDQHNQRRNLYSKKEILGRLNSLLRLPQVDKQTNTYVDEAGEVWVVAKSYRYKCGISSKLLTKDIRSIQGRDKCNHVITLYSQSDVNKKISDRVAIPQVDQETNAYIDEHGETWVLISSLVSELGGSIASFYKEVKSTKQVPTKEGRDRLGRASLMYKAEALRQFLQDWRNKEIIVISSKDADEALGRLIK